MQWDASRFTHFRLRCAGGFGFHPSAFILCLLVCHRMAVSACAFGTCASHRTLQSSLLSIFMAGGLELRIVSPYFLFAFVFATPHIVADDSPLGIDGCYRSVRRSCMETRVSSPAPDTGDREPVVGFSQCHADFPIIVKVSGEGVVLEVLLFIFTGQCFSHFNLLCFGLVFCLLGEVPIWHRSVPVLRL